MPRPTDPAAFTADAELRPGYFVQAATRFLRAPNVTPYAKVLYLVLCSYAGAGATAWPGQGRLAQECGCSERMIRKVLTAELVPLGLVEVHQQGLNRTNRYHLHKLPTLDRHSMPIQTGTQRRARTARGAEKVDSGNIESGEGSRPQNPPAFTPAPGLRTADEIHAEQRRRRL
jgi:hypothetical protein